MTVDAQLMSLNAVLEAAHAQGTSTTWEPFKEAVFADKEMKAALIAVPQGPKRVIYLVNKDVGAAFAERYATAYKTKNEAKQEAKRTAAAAQMQIEFVGEEPAGALEALTERVGRLEDMIHTLDARIERLIVMWDTVGDDGK